MQVRSSTPPPARGWQPPGDGRGGCVHGHPRPEGATWPPPHPATGRSPRHRRAGRGGRTAGRSGCGAGCDRRGRCASPGGRHPRPPGTSGRDRVPAGGVRRCGCPPIRRGLDSRTAAAAGRGRRRRSRSGTSGSTVGPGGGIWTVAVCRAMTRGAGRRQDLLELGQRPHRGLLDAGHDSRRRRCEARQRPRRLRRRPAAAAAGPRPRRGGSRLHAGAREHG